MKLEITDIEKADIFTQIFQNIKLFTTSASITFSEDRLYLQGMDSSHVSIFEFNLMKEWFDVYEISGPTTIGINTIIFHKILGTRGPEHKIVLVLDEADQDKMSIDFVCDDKGIFNKEFHMPLMDIDVEHMGIPDADYELEFTLTSKKMKSIVDELAHFGDTINISFDNATDTVYFSAEMEAEGAMKLKASIDDFDSCTVDDEAKIDSGFATRFIQFMTHFHKLNKVCTIYIQNDMPLQFKYALDAIEVGNDTETNKQNYARFFLAPKISDMDES